MQKIVPCLWFNGNAEEAVNFYMEIFKGRGLEVRVVGREKFGEAGSEVSKQPTGSVMVVKFVLNGQEFVGLNGGPDFKFNEAVSFMVNCENQEEVDYFWKRLTEGGQEVQCGWLKDKFGLSWQIVPAVLEKMMSDPDPEKANRVMKALLSMKKIEIAELEKAYH